MVLMIGDFMWNMDELEFNLKIINDRINNLGYSDRQLLVRRDLYYSLLENSGNFKDCKIPYFLNCIKLYKYTDNYKSHEEFNYILSDYIISPNDELLKILKSIKNKADFNRLDYLKKVDLNFNIINISVEDQIKIARDFYENLNETIYYLVDDYLKESQFLNYSSCLSYDRRNSSGITFYDFERFYAYVVVRKTNTIRDLSALVHELAHVVDFMCKAKSFENHCFYYHEIIPYTIDLIFIDYLLDNQIYSKEANKLLAQKVVNICTKEKSCDLDYQFKLFVFYLADYLYNEYKQCKSTHTIEKFMRERIQTNDILNYFYDNKKVDQKSIFEKQKILDKRPYKDYYNRWWENNE